MEMEPEQRVVEDTFPSIATSAVGVSPRSEGAVPPNAPRERRDRRRLVGLSAAPEPSLRPSPTCRQCGSENQASSRFCSACGAALASPAEARPGRKIVTALFCDVSGWTALSDGVDPEILRSVLNRYFSELRAIIERHGGTVEKYIGDAVMAVFGIPRTHEDDALRAVRAAAEFRDRLPTVAQEAGLALRFRTGVNTGVVFTGAGGNLAVGNALNLAARLEQSAQPGEILLGEETLALARDAVSVQALEPLAVKGRSDPLPAFRLLGVDPLALGISPRLDGPMVGREEELRLLRDVWSRVVEESRCRLCTIAGDAGIGKSRLAAELLVSVKTAATVLRGRCLQYGDGITFWPLIEALRPIGERVDSLLARLNSGDWAVPEELFLDVRRPLEELAIKQPLILLIEDLHWAQPMLLDLLDYLIDLSRGAPILLLCTARLELLGQRPDWEARTTIRLGRLSQAESAVLLDQLGSRLDAGTRARVMAASEGNPLFLEEMVTLARDHTTVLVPPSIQALLTARLERLVGEEREVLERGAVEGDVFHRSAVCALSGERAAGEVEYRLRRLVHQEFINPHPAMVGRDQAFRFRTLLIRDAAYDALPKVARAELHKSFGHWLTGTFPESGELDEIAGWHFERAVRYRRELAMEVKPDLAHRAASHLLAAALRARDHSDVAMMNDFLERALALAPLGDELRARICLDFAERLIEAGEFGRADELLSEAERVPKFSADAALTRFEWLIRVNPKEAPAVIQSKLPAIREQFVRAGDERGVARAHLAIFWVHRLASEWTAAGEHARLAALHARLADDETLRSRALGLFIASAVYGRQGAEVIADELDMIERETPGAYLTAFVDRGRSELARLAADFDAARRLAVRAIETFQALGLPEMVALGEVDRARVELTAGKPGAAAGALRRAEAILVRLGERPLRSVVQAMLAQAHVRMRHHRAARRAIALALQLDPPYDVVTNTYQVQAQLALQAGDVNAAERWSRHAVELASRSDNVVVQARASLDRAYVLSSLGQRGEAAAEADAALELFRAKGDRAGGYQTQALLEELAASNRRPDPARITRCTPTS